MAQKKVNEYWKNVSPPKNIPLAGADREYPVDELKELCRKLKLIQNEHEQKQLIKETIAANPTILNILRLLVFKTDTRVELDLSYILKNEQDADKNTTLCGCEPDDMKHHHMDKIFSFLQDDDKNRRKKIIEVVSDYFFKNGLVKFLCIFSKLEDDEQNNMLQSMIESDNRQSEAKRRGHGAERELARVVIELGCSILPENKIENAMAGDVRLNKSDFNITGDSDDNTTSSYDLVILDSNNKIRICVISLIHTSNPGQYGKDKINKTPRYKEEFAKYNSKNYDKKILCALVDGTGFSMSKGNLDNILDNVEHFFQINTLYKIGLLLHKFGLCKIEAIMLDRTFYSDAEILDIKEKYMNDDIVLIEKEDQINPKWKKIQAGKGILFIKQS